MAGLLDGIDSRTRLAGNNRLELLLFHLGGRQHFGINVFKVQEVIPCPPLSQLPSASNVVCGVATLRGRTISIIDLSMAILGRPMPDEVTKNVIVTEYNRQVQGFLVGGMDRIVNMDWGDILPPPKGAGDRHYLTAVTRVDERLVEILDVEKVLAEVVGVVEDIDDAFIDSDNGPSQDQHVLVADDSAMARKQMKRVLDQMGVSCTLCSDGKAAWEQLQSWVAEGRDLKNWLAMVLSDVEMPQMDGYSLTTRIRQDPALSHLYVVLHTSLSGVFNNQLVEKVGANEFRSKWEPDALAQTVHDQLKRHADQAAQ